MKRALFMKYRLLLSCLLVIFFFSASSQQLSYFDGAAAYNKLLVEKNNGSFYRIGNFKVIGSPYLFGEKHIADVFAGKERAANIQVSFNVYTQEIEFYPTAKTEKPLVKKTGEVDTFEMKADKDVLLSNLKFIYGPLIGLTEKVYVQVVYAGPKYSLYKKYNCTLAVVSTNYIESELRQFNLEPQYLYKSSASDEVKKLKPNKNAVTKEFKAVKDLSSIFDPQDLVTNTEGTLKNIFEALNK
jgi:hypothetical protein